ncbi:MAG TPA: serine hydrolase [Vicinamibacterales bacterium]|jgi:CubicO group peptidase (beta-lactamase class C family)|nr:serine hydrolase [Vicinamibacterales bacterium]
MLLPIRIPSVLVAVVVALCLKASPAAQPAPLTGFDDLVARAMKDWRVPGLAMAVAKDGKVVVERGYGVRQLGQPAPVDSHTLFAIGSTTKAMTAALVGMLVDDKLLAWDDPVVKHLPWFQLKDPAVTRELTVRDLLTHRGGLGNADYLWYGQSNSTEEILKRVRLIEPAYSVRSSFIYQNIMYAAAGAVIEAAGHKPWAETIRLRIFEPLGMRDSIATAATLEAHANVAAPHDIVGGQVRVIENMSVDPVASAGAVWSSVSDMARWMQFLLDGGRIGGSGGKRLIGEATFAELFKPQTIAPFDMYPTTSVVKPHWMTYGLGWFQQDYRGRAVDFHTGSIDGMTAIHGLMRDDRLGVYVLANLDHAEVRHALMYTVLDRYIGAPERDWSAELLKLYTGIKRQADESREKEEAKRVRGTTPSLPLAQYAGTYSDPLRGDVEVTLSDGGLRLRHGPGFVGRLEHWHYNTFRAKWTAEWHAPALVTFALDAEGKPTDVDLMGGRFVRRP